jgi:hypothetical protein
MPRRVAAGLVRFYDARVNRQPRLLFQTRRTGHSPYRPSLRKDTWAWLVVYGPTWVVILLQAVAFYFSARTGDWWIALLPAGLALLLMLPAMALGWRARHR